MKKMTLGSVLFSLLFGSLFSVSAQSEPRPMHPWVRVCAQYGGEVWVGESLAGEQPMLCTFGSSAIGAEAFFIQKTGGGNPQAISAYLLGDRYCKGVVSNAVGTDGRQFVLCTYGDGSVNESATLQHGPGSSYNQRLDNALKN